MTILNLKELGRKFSNFSLLIIIPIAVFIHSYFFLHYLEQYQDNRKISSQNKTDMAIFQILTTGATHLSIPQLQNILTIIKDNKLHFGSSEVQLNLLDLRNTSIPKPIETKIIHNNMTLYLSPDHLLEFKVIPNYDFYQLLIFVTLIEITLLALYLFYILSLRRFKAPLKRFKESADKLGIDINSKPIRLLGPPIAQEAANAMNQMQTRIQSLMHNRTQMLAAISHDLRNPITRIKLRSENLAAQEEGEKILADLSEMEQMISDILQFSSEDILHEKKALFDLASLVNSICEDFSDQGNLIDTHIIQQRVPVFASKLAIKRAISNLIQNATKFATHITVDLFIENKTIHLMIEDNGPGIPEDELSKVLLPYYRSKQMNNQKIGCGLGLSIANEIIQKHQGCISLTNRKQGGLIIKITLPYTANVT